MQIFLHIQIPEKISYCLKKSMFVPKFFFTVTLALKKNSLKKNPEKLKKMAALF